ncbi:hypothetical protein XM38_014430 [Halomicronema hongdechloris C2206]|uniref:SnoaL-like domain-containing protein n=1 Tax=Halomicronema hongdechloris C2206 TaxID=1641165 RepID=A0A1V8NMI0_9CYAN|nr:DUF2358 domain-containing protein [Halomicronema hongdechloris]ASC70504.1 hypothetical protein XM38_014430 [Halomicronema hongdechloris C2206]
MDILERLKQDYQRFPEDQSYDLYADQVYFQDPLNRFRGLARYRQMIQFIRRWFIDIDLQLHAIDRHADQIVTRWTLAFTAPLPWRPRIAIPGHSELQLNPAGQIISHIDYWDCSRWAVLRQVMMSTD